MSHSIVFQVSMLAKSFSCLAKMSPVDKLRNQSHILALSRISSRVGEVRWVYGLPPGIDSGAEPRMFAKASCPPVL
jgi:hypothetical protein